MFVPVCVCVCLPHSWSFFTSLRLLVKSSFSSPRALPPFPLRLSLLDRPCNIFFSFILSFPTSQQHKANMCNANKLTQCRVARSYTHSAHSHISLSSTVCRGGLVVSRAQPKALFLSNPNGKNCFSAEQPKSVQIEPSMWTGSDCCGSLFSSSFKARPGVHWVFCVVCVF